MAEVCIRCRHSRLVPGDDWNNPKRHISALVKGGKIVAQAESTLGGRPICSTILGRSCHAEMSVLKLISSKLGNKRKLAKYTMWNARWTRNGDLANAKPCLHCQQVLIRIGIKNIVFSTNQGVFIKSKLSQLDCHLSSGYRY